MSSFLRTSPAYWVAPLGADAMVAKATTRITASLKNVISISHPPLIIWNPFPMITLSGCSVMMLVTPVIKARNTTNVPHNQLRICIRVAIYRDQPVLSPEPVEGSQEWYSYRCLCITVRAADTKLIKRKISPLGRNDTLSCHLECVNFASIPSLLYPRFSNLGYPPLTLPHK